MYSLSSVPRCKYNRCDDDFRRPLNKHSSQRLKKRADEIMDYFKNLKTDDRTLIVELFDA